MNKEKRFDGAFTVKPFFFILRFFSASGLVIAAAVFVLMVLAHRAGGD